MKIRRPFRAVVYLAVIAAAVGYVVFSAFQQHNTTRHSQLTPSRSFAIVLTGGKWVPVDSPDLDTGRIDDGTVMSIHQSEYQWGPWHALVAQQELLVRCEDCLRSSPITDNQITSVLAMVQSAQPHLLRTDLLQARTAGTPIRRILWLGVLGDLSILAAFAAIIFSLVKLRREIRWRKPGCCIECDYDLAGLTTNQCPECGAAVAPATRTRGA